MNKDSIYFFFFVYLSSSNGEYRTWNTFCRLGSHDKRYRACRHLAKTFYFCSKTKILNNKTYDIQSI